MTTCTQLLHQKWGTCSCCGRDTQPGGALVNTGDGDRVEWIMCWQCEEVCERLANLAGQLNCPFGACRRDARYTRKSQRRSEGWKREAGARAIGEIRQWTK